MRNSLSEDRKRFLISAGTALALHILILVVVGLNRAEYSYEPEFGPVSVQISLNRPNERIKEPEPVEAFQADEAPEAEAVNEAEIVPSEPEPQPVPVPRPTESAAASNPPPARPKAEVTAAETDDSFLEAIRSRSSGSSGGIDARSVFGDDPVPATTDSGSAAASWFADDNESGSEVLLSDAPAAGQKPTESVEEAPSAVSVIERGTLSSLDRSLSAVDTDDTDNTTSANTVVSSADTVSGSVTGNSPVFTFRDPSVSRELREWAPPVIPEDIQTAGIPRYVIEIEFYIDSDGITSNARVVKSTTNPRLDAAVQAALRGWRFEDSSEQKKVRATLTYVIEIK